MRPNPSLARGAELLRCRIKYYHRKWKKVGVADSESVDIVHILRRSCWNNPLPQDNFELFIDGGRKEEITEAAWNDAFKILSSPFMVWRSLNKRNELSRVEKMKKWRPAPWLPSSWLSPPYFSHFECSKWILRTIPCPCLSWLLWSLFLAFTHAQTRITTCPNVHQVKGASLTRVHKSSQKIQTEQCIIHRKQTLYYSYFDVSFYKALFGFTHTLPKAHVSQQILHLVLSCLRLSYCKRLFQLFRDP